MESGSHKWPNSWADLKSVQRNKHKAAKLYIVEKLTNKEKNLILITFRLFKYVM